MRKAEIMSLGINPGEGADCKMRWADADLADFFLLPFLNVQFFLG